MHSRDGENEDASDWEGLNSGINGDDDESSVDMDDGEDTDDEDEDSEFRKKVEEALRAHGVEAGVSESEDNSGEVLLDDDQMMVIDEQLAEIFKSRANKKIGNGSCCYFNSLNHNRILLTESCDLRCECPSRGYPFQEPSS